MLNDGRVHRAVLPAAILLTSAAAIACQFVQNTDATFPLAYFTVDSAVFAGGVACVALLRPAREGLVLLRASSSVAVLVSAIVFAAVIAPASMTGSWVQPHDDYWVRAATFLFHLIVPILVTLDFVGHDMGPTQFRAVLLSCLAWPVLYIAGLGALIALDVAKMPYPFLDPGEFGAHVVVQSLGGMALLIGVLVVALWSANRRWSRTQR
jgi:hypothetical protein